MWPSFTSSFSNRDKMKIQLQQPTRNLNINDEYLCAVRTKSYADFFIQAQLMLVNEQNSTHCHPSILLNPDQETTTSLLESSILSNKPSHQKTLLSNYFNISAEASNLCSHLIKSLNQLQTNYRSINKTINSIHPDDDDDDDDDDSSRRLAVGFELMTSDLRNPFPDLNGQDFKRAQERHSSVLQQLRSNRKRMKRKIKLMKFFNKASSVCITAACGAAAAAAMFLAVHTLAVLLMGPAALISVPLKPFRKKMRSFRFFKYGVMRRVVEQLDVAAKGAYILKRDFDTIGRLVERIEDEVEHSRAMMEMCLERREDRHCLQVLKEVNKYEFGVRKQAEELQEHVYLCLVTINRARAMVVREICRTNSADLNYVIN